MLLVLLGQGLLTARWQRQLQLSSCSGLLGCASVNTMTLQVPSWRPQAALGCTERSRAVDCHAGKISSLSAATGPGRVGSMHATLTVQVASWCTEEAAVVHGLQQRYQELFNGMLATSADAQRLYAAMAGQKKQAQQALAAKERALASVQQQLTK